MAKQWDHGFYQGEKQGLTQGNAEGSQVALYVFADQMRVLFCALATAKQRQDDNAFYSTLEIAKTVVGKHINLTDDEWSVFRGSPQQENNLKS